MLMSTPIWISALPQQVPATKIISPTTLNTRLNIQYKKKIVCRYLPQQVPETQIVSSSILIQILLCDSSMSLPAGMHERSHSSPVQQLDRHALHLVDCPSQLILHLSVFHDK